MIDIGRFRTALAEIVDAYIALSARPPIPQRRGRGPKVTSSAQPAVPVDLDVIDLTMPARPGSIIVGRHDEHPDQIGDHSIATELDFWVRDIAGELGERLPVPVVPELARWLSERSAWAADHYGAWDEMATAIDRVARRLWSMLEPAQARPTPKSAPCPGCGQETLSGDGERVWCSDRDTCGRILTETEYGAWSQSVLHRELNGDEGVSARQIAIQYGRPVSTVHRWASVCRWQRSPGTERPVLYLREQVEASVARILAKEVRDTGAEVA